MLEFECDSRLLAAELFVMRNFIQKLLFRYLHSAKMVFLVVCGKQKIGMGN